MKASEKVIRFISVFLTACAVSVGTVFTFSTAFSIRIGSAPVIAACLGSALLASLLCLSELIWPFLLGLEILFGIGLWLFRDAFRRSLIPVICSVGELYIKSFSGLKDATLSLQPVPGTDGTLFLALLGGLLAFLCVLSLVRLRRLWPFLPFCLLLLISCLVSTLSVPALWAFLLLLFALVLLLLTQSQRHRQSPTEYLSLLILMLPAALLLLAAILFVRPSVYKQPDQIASLSDRLSDFAKQSPVLSRFQPPFDDKPAREVMSFSNQIDLSTLGSREEIRREIFRVYSARTRSLYLKGVAYGSFEDNSWQLLPDELYQESSVSSADWYTAMVPCSHCYDNSDILSNPEDTLLRIAPTIETSYLLIPNRAQKIPPEARIDYDRFVEAPDPLAEYEITLFPYESSVNLYPANLIPFLEEYRQVPDSVRTALRTVLTGLQDQIGDPEPAGYADRCARAIDEYVRASARYSIQTETMPTGDDFVRWFLEDCDRGYCVHFATAATVLLRCFGIPARYVSGFAVSASAGTWTSVTGVMTHAWTEYFDGTAWRILDATPPGSPAEELPVPEQPEDVTEEPDAEDVRIESHEWNSTVPSSAPEPVRPDSPAVSRFNPFYLLLIPVPLLLFLLGRFVRLLRQKSLSRRSRRERLLRSYRYLERLTRLSYSKPDEAMRELAEKARFSQHKPTMEEYRLMQRAVQQQRQKLRDYPSRIKRFYFRVILGI